MAAKGHRLVRIDRKLLFQIVRKVIGEHLRAKYGDLKIMRTDLFDTELVLEVVGEQFNRQKDWEEIPFPPFEGV
jgi:hypothetical protein